jgi:gliding motility-associated lipoprotein GldH
VKRTFIPFLLACLLVAGCAEHVLFQEDAQVPDGRWERNWTPTFHFDVEDTLGAHDIYLDLRHTGDYPYSNIYTFITLEGPDGGRLVDTVECLLADPTGRWYGEGEGFIRSFRKAHVLYKLRNRFPRKGRYAITLEQAMRVDSLPGIIDVGVSIERARPTQGDQP